MDDLPAHLNQTFIRCLKKFSHHCIPACGYLSGRDMISACINISVQSTLEWFQYGLNHVVNDQYLVSLAIPLYGVISPILATITLIFNSLIFCVLFKKTMLSPTNMILIGITFCDTITILSPMTWYIHTYAASGYQEYPTYNWCIIYRYFGSMIPTWFHNSAVWLTVMLSVHRYIGITHPNIARTVCGYKSVFKGIALTLILLLTFIFSQLIFQDMEKVTVISRKIIDKQGVIYVDTCHFEPSANVDQDTYITYFKVYPCLRVALCNILPCTLLVIFNILLIRKTYQSYYYRKKLLAGSRKLRHLEFSEIARTTIMLITVCLLTLVVEIPNAVIFSLHVVHAIMNTSTPNIRIWLTFPNFILFLTYPAYFMLYTTMNRRFRRCLKNICCRKPRDGIYNVSSAIDEK